jgi:hypothetical protein
MENIDTVDKKAISILGYLYTFLSVSTFAVASVMTKLIFTRNPDFSVSEFLYLRALI